LRVISRRVQDYGKSRVAGGGKGKIASKRSSGAYFEGNAYYIIIKKKKLFGFRAQDIYRRESRPWTQWNIETKPDC